MTTKTTHFHTPTSGTPSETPSESPTGVPPVRRASGSPGPLSYGGDPLARPRTTDPTHEPPSGTPTENCGHQITTHTGTWTCTIQGPHRVLDDGRTCHTFTKLRGAA